MDDALGNEFSGDILYGLKKLGMYWQKLMSL